jgi:hypothetical protein
MASSLGPISGFANMKFTWSRISIKSPTLNAAFSAPAALETTIAFTPSAAIACVAKTALRAECPS